MTIHISEATQRALDAIGGYVIEPRGIVNVKVVGLIRLILFLHCLLV